ncbi:MAG TPA: OB-fold domain-containing protein [Mycobacteriales bacterium]|nr:OB-fold domain-containing protein [Mycobacteriales bacterium]
MTNEPARRPLPHVGPDNDFFWRAGADGVLRFQRCSECQQLRFPVAPVCPYCLSYVTEIADVSGAAVVVGATENHQQWSPALPPPYVIAVVAIDEDPRIRLTTNIVGCPLTDVHLGLRVAVKFEQVADVWLPLFAPTGEPDRDWAVPDPTPARRPARVPDERFESRVAITGVGMSQVGRRLMRPALELTIDAARAAVEDAGLTLDDVDGLATYPGGAGSGGFSEGGVTALVEALRLQPAWINGGAETPGQLGAVVSAMLAVAAGLCRHVLCFRTVWESSYTALARSGALRSERGGGRASGMTELRAPFGAMSAANWIAMAASQHFARYGTTREQLGAIALTARANAALNPSAVYTDPLTMDDYLSARVVSTPFGLYDCDVPCDGAVAIIVSARDAARDLRQPPVLVDSVGTQITDRLSWDQGTLTHEPQVFGPAQHLWRRSSLRPADVDVALLYDGFTFNCLSWIEALGFCELGEGGAFVEAGTRIARDGELPLNPHGGQLSAGRLHGFGFVHEAVQQLRGQAGPRQVTGAEVAVVTTGGGTPGGCALFTTDHD